MTRHVQYPSLLDRANDYVDLVHSWQDEREWLLGEPRRSPRTATPPSLVAARCLLAAVWAVVLVGLPMLLRAVGGSLG